MAYEPASDLQGDDLILTSTIATIDESVVGQGVVQSKAYRDFRVLLENEEMTDIQVDSWDRIFLKRRGLYERLLDGTGNPWSPFNDEKSLIEVLNQILAESTHPWKKIPADFRAIRNPKQAAIETRMSDLSRIQITCPPIADTVSCTIAKFSRKRMTMKDILDSGTMSTKMANFLMWCIDAKISIMIVGAGGAGKTTLLQALGQRFGLHDKNEHVLVVEDTPELKIESPDTDGIIYWRTVPNDDGILDDDVDLSYLIKTSLRRRIQRLVVSEVRGEEAWAMVDANNTGTTGTLCTVHGNDVESAVFRLQNLCLRSGVNGLTLGSVRRDIGTAFQVVVWLNRDIEGRYLVKEISELSIQKDGDNATLNVTKLFTYGFDPEGKPVAKHAEAPSQGLKEIAMDRAGIPCPTPFSEIDERDFRRGR